MHMPLRENRFGKFEGDERDFKSFHGGNFFWKGFKTNELESMKKN